MKTTLTMAIRIRVRFRVTPTVIRRLAQAVADRGIKKISGHVIIDISLFPEGTRELGTGVVLAGSGERQFD
jgi:hypothetical protein